jgi:hypothetical protein
MKKRLLISGIVLAALLLALYGVIFGDRGEVMFPMAFAVPLALLPIVSLMATLRWMALSSG